MRPLRNRLQQARQRLGAPWEVLERDYLLSWVLAGIDRVPALGCKLVFKGGTALRKCYFGDYRFSEDLDFSGLDGTPTGDTMEVLVQEACAAAERMLAEYAPVDFFREFILAHVEGTWEQWLGPLVPGLPSFETVVRSLRPQVSRERANNCFVTRECRSEQIFCCRRDAGRGFGGNLVQHNATGADKGAASLADAPPGTVVVRAEGSVHAVLDIAVLGIGVETTEPSVAAARDRAARVTEAVIDEFQRLGVEQRDVQTSRFSIQPEHQYADDGRRRLTGYRVAHALTVTYRDLDTVETAIDAVPEAGGDELAFRSIAFAHANPDRYLEAARRKR